MPRSAYSRRGVKPKTASTAGTSALLSLPSSSPSAPLSDHGSERPNPEAAKSGSDRLVFDPRSGRLATEDAMKLFATTMGRTHKSNFSVTAYLGAQSEAIFGSKSRQPEPKPPGNSGGNHIRSGSQAWNGLERQGSSTEPQTPLVLEVPLKLKLSSFKGLGKVKSRPDEGGRTPTVTNRPQSSLSVRSPLGNARSPFSSDTVAPGALQLTSTNPDDSYLISSRDPNSEEGSDPSWDTNSTPPFSLASTLGQEESMPQTPCTIQSEFFRFGTPSLLGGTSLHRDMNYDMLLSDNLPPSFLQSRKRTLPTISQDDMSLYLQTIAEKRESINRMSRRASLSATSMLSYSSAPHQASSSTSRISDGGHSYTEHELSPQSTPTRTDSGYETGGQGITPVTPLSPMRFQSIPSPLPRPARLPAAELTAIAPPPPPSKDDSAHTPTASSHPEISFKGNFAPLRSSRSNSPSHGAAQNRSLELSTSRSATPETPSATRTRSNITPAQMQKWEEDERVLTEEIKESNSGEAVVIRFEPKHGWMGFWNRSSMEVVIDELRELRIPRFSA